MSEMTEDYFAEAHRWERDRTTLLRREARRAWQVALSGVTLAALSLGTLLVMLPLKRTEPYLIRVDAAAGTVDVVPRYVPTMELPEAVTRHLVTEYVMARERYAPAFAEADYRQVSAYQSAAMNQALSTLWARGNPDSPLNRYSDRATLRVKVNAVSFLKRVSGEPMIVQVRFETGLITMVGAAEDRHQFVATLQASYTEPASEAETRALNPLGFRVLEYRRESETLTSPSTSQTSNNTTTIGK